MYRNKPEIKTKFVSSSLWFRVFSIMATVIIHRKIGMYGNILNAINLVLKKERRIIGNNTIKRSSMSFFSSFLVATPQMIKMIKYNVTNRYIDKLKSIFRWFRAGRLIIPVPTKLWMNKPSIDLI
jgi:hypothetical protein